MREEKSFPQTSENSNQINTSTKYNQPTMSTAVNAGSNKKPNPIVFMDISIGGQPIGRMQMELFADQVPKTAENFRYVLPALDRRSIDG